VGEIARLAPLAAPRVGVITNASPAHLAGFGSLEAIVRAKGELLDVLPPDGTAVLNADSAGFADWARRAPCAVVAHGEGAGDHRWRWTAAGDPQRGFLTLDGESWDVPLPGRHNGANLAAALLAARAAGLEAAAIRVGLAGFRPSPHRSHLEMVGGVRLLDDCYNANPESVVSAARSVVELGGGGRAIAVLGPMAELGERSAELHRETGRRLAAVGLDQLVAVGAAAAELAAGCRAGGRAALGPRAGDRVLVKGSRSAAMEQVIALWRQAVGAAGPDAPDDR
jgi:UDP-N-acetylmuramoyl-tripeptide--D-alanyl-D-alanine ligase